MPLTRPRLIAAALAGILIACVIAATLQLLPRIRLGGAIEGVQWVQAAGSMFWALPLTLCALAGAGGLYAMAIVLGIRSRMLTAGFVGMGAVVGAGGFVGIGTPWYELADGVAGESVGMGVAAFGVTAGLYLLVSIRRGAATQPAG